MVRATTIEVRGLVKNYVTYERRGFIRKKKKIIRALRGVTFKVYEGEVYGLLGPNGAGKTTTVKILCTLLLPDGGEAKVLGYDVVKEAKNVREVIGATLSVERGFFWKLTGRENLKYFGMLYGLDGKELEKRVNHTLEITGLNELKASDKLYEEYSLGMKARLALARALLKDPPVLILDEPTLGLDPPSARKIRDLLIRLAHEHGKTVLMTTHNMFEAEMVCDRVGIINKGVIIAEGTPEELKRKVSNEMPIQMRILTGLPSEAIRKLISEKISYPFTIETSEGRGMRLRFIVPSNEVDEATAKILARLHETKCKILEVKVSEPSLEDVFIKLTGKGGSIE